MRKVTRWWRNGLLCILVGLASLTAVIGWNLSQFSSRQLDVAAIAPVTLEDDVLLQRFSESISIPTITTQPARITSDSALHEFDEFLSRSFPSLHGPPVSVFTGKDFGDASIPSILFEWPGKNPKLDAVLLMSHFDVVPAAVNAMSTDTGWTFPPFSGHVDEKYVWGRGALDCKHGVMGIIEAINLLIAEGHEPDRTLLVALGHDEELGGLNGNRKIAEWLSQRGRRLHVILDEGGCIFTEFPGVDRPAALVGIAEKGIAAVDLIVELPAEKIGHASMPPEETAVTILAGAIERIQQNPFPAKIEGGLQQTLAFIGPEMPKLSSRVAASNLWLFAPIVRSMLSETPSGNALLRSTIAPTVLAVEGENDNVLPRTAKATLNLRLMPGTSIEAALAHLRNSIGDRRVSVTARSHSKEASAVSRIDSEQFESLHKTIRQIFPDVVVAPFVLVGSTDTPHYSSLCQDVYRFIPARLSERDTKRFHGIDERIAKQDYLNIVRFYRQFILNTTIVASD